MRRPLHLCLILLLLVTATALGHARGQSRMAGQVVLCGGGVATVLTVTRDGQPAHAAHLCPDMALSLLAGFAPTMPEVARPDLPGRADWVPRESVARATGMASVQARGPPSAG